MKLFRIPVKIDIAFFVVVAFLGFSRSGNLTLLIEWVVVVFLSVLLHEFGHALTATAFGLQAEIRLYQMGGLTSYRGEKEVTPLRRLAISLAGPTAGLLLGLVVFLFRPLFLSFESELMRVIYFDLVWVNVAWGIFNLLPMLPMDGGHVLATLETWLLKRKDQLVSHIISFLGALALAAAAISWRAVWIAFLGIFFAYVNGSALFTRLQTYRDRKLQQPLDDARSAIQREEFDEALDILKKVRARAKSDEVKRTVAHLMIVVLLNQKKLEQAEEELSRYTALFGGDVYLQGALHFLKGEMTEVLPHLKASFEHFPEKQVGVMLCKALMATEDFAGAFELCRHPATAEVSWELTVELATEAFNRGAFKVSAEAGVVAFNQKADPKVAYNVACAFSRDANLSESLEWLDRAIESGFDDKDALVSDPDLNEVRSLPGFADVLTKMRSQT